MRSMPRVCSRGRLSKAFSICSRAPLGRAPSYWFSIRIAIEVSHFRGSSEGGQVRMKLSLKLVCHRAEAGTTNNGGVFREDPGSVSTFRRNFTIVVGKEDD